MARFTKKKKWILPFSNFFNFFLLNLDFISSSRERFNSSNLDVCCKDAFYYCSYKKFSILVPKKKKKKSSTYRVILHFCTDIQTHKTHRHTGIFQSCSGGFDTSMSSYMKIIWNHRPFFLFHKYKNDKNTSATL